MKAIITDIVQNWRGKKDYVGVDTADFLAWCIIGTAILVGAVLIYIANR
jgi:hypothetical protein